MAEDSRQDPTGQPSTERVSVPQAADHLGTTVDALRKRVQRRTIPHEKDPDGRVWILLDTGRPRQDTDQGAAGHRQDTGGELVEELRDRVAFLERQLERQGDETERLHQIIGGLAQANAEQARTIRAIEAPATEEATEDAETVEEAPEPQPAPADPETATQSPQADDEDRRPWWRRFFGF